MSEPNERVGAPSRLYGWRHPTVLAAAGLSVASGFAQFAAIAALGDVATAFGAAGEGTSLTARLGLSGITIGIGLGVIRLAALGSLPLANAADRIGRRRVLLWVTAGGLALTTVAAASPGYWWFVALFALGRPLLSATNVLCGVIAAEETRSGARSAAIAVVTAGYGIGAGLTVIVRTLGGEALGFRGLFALAAIPLIAVVVLGRFIEEPERFELLTRGARAGRFRTRLGHVRADLRPRLLLLATVTFSVGFTSAWTTGFLFVYSENALGLSPTFTTGIVVAAGALGLPGLLFGRWAADHLGRRVTAGVAHVVVAMSGAITYSGTVAAAAGGYLVNILFGSIYAPGAGALSAEVFPTSMRATAAGWLTVAGVLGAVTGLVAFGLTADALGDLGAAALRLTVPAACMAVGYRFLPETRGLELEQSAPEEA